MAKANSKAPATRAAAKAKSAAPKAQAATFVWYDVMTTDMDAAAKFYKAALGWTAKDASQPGTTYSLFHAENRMVAGALPIPADMTAMPPCWTGYIGVPDLAATLKKIKAAGGSLQKGPWTVPGVGDMAVVADPHGAVFMLMQAQGSGSNPPVSPGTPDHAGWHELYAGDLETAWAFYSKVFGWTTSKSVDLGPMGTYRLFAAGGADIGGMMTRPPHLSHPHWGYYFSVDKLDAAVARVTKAKGKVHHGPVQVPGGMWIAQCADPQGASFALIAKGR